MKKCNLYVDVTAKTCILTLFNSDNQLIDESITQTNNNLIELVNPKLEELMQRNNISFADLAKIYVIYGPGSFTGVRVGVNLAKTIKSVYSDVEILVMNTLKAMCLGNGLATLDAKGKKWYIAGYQDNKEVLPLTMVFEEEKNQLIQAHKDLRYYSDEEITDIKRAEFAYKMLDQFEPVENWIELEPLYIKEAL
ncbi:tRNA (adenosine(37)-N6)-threonylcarbamoyltransferase complex dimerization subunit type 1 TsaB [Ureaplasma ceti]|uniref:tRNA (Adenosine(37)-N6)-threonylcarbamoyltransferase complex dimerization subunit type 1 TsaB n=1 Tax=Ureaplasma ceti TaxID=3119530 RepID=A0ABP9U5N1_9BACT